MKLPAPLQIPGVPTGVPGVPYGNVSLLRRVMKKVGSERVGRYQAEIYEQTTLLNQRGMGRDFTMRFWLAPGIPVPVKVVSNMGTGQSVTLLKTIQTNTTLPDSMFELPKGTKITTQQLPTPGTRTPGAVPH